MMSEPLKLPEPWSWLITQEQPLHSATPMDGWGTPRLLFPVEQRPPVVVLPTGQDLLPVASFPFLLGENRIQAFHLPIDPRPRHEHEEFPLILFLLDGMVELHQIHVVPRPRDKRGEQPSTQSLGQIVDAWIDWQVWAFQELGHLPEQLEEFDALTRASCIRRSWEAATSVWLHEGRDEALMALIVQLSREQPLHRALDAISRYPRRILQRNRDETPLSRIQELDSVCIRDFARRPGITAFEKAGPRQRLLAVRRREQYNTLENQVTCWVMESGVELASEYCRANAVFTSDAKVRQVRAFGLRNRTWRTSEWLRDVGTLHHHSTGPNYPLQFEPRYKIVWKTYRRIRDDKRVKDDAWAWQRVLWGETGRQLIGCCLYGQFKSVAVSTPFYRTESRQGFWTEPPVAPGPFSNPGGDCLVFDSRDLASASGRARQQWIERPPFRGAQYIGASGCDQVLLWPKLNRGLLVWHFYHTALGRDEGGLAGIVARCGQAVEQLTADMRRFAQSQLQLSGLILVADLGCYATQFESEDEPCVVRERGSPMSNGGVVNALCLPPNVNARRRFVHDLKTDFQVVIDELLGEL
jgi:Domain of unknown function (DUF2357)